MSEITLYKSTSDTRKLIKSLKNPLIKQISIRTDIDIYNPTLLLQDFDLAYNYLKWENRYYFINSAYYTANQVWRLSCHIDVLMTYSNEILKASGTVIRIGNNNYLANASIPVTSKPSYIQYVFPNEPFKRNTNNYILTAIGGETTQS